MISTPSQVSTHVATNVHDIAGKDKKNEIVKVENEGHIADQLIFNKEENDIQGILSSNSTNVSIPKHTNDLNHGGLILPKIVSKNEDDLNHGGLILPKLESKDENENALDTAIIGEDSFLPTNCNEPPLIRAYARLDFSTKPLYVQTLQVVLGRRAENDSGMVDVDLGPRKGISRRHAKLFYNFGTQRFELSVMGRNGAFVNGHFIPSGDTVHLHDGDKIQIAGEEFTFVLPSVPAELESDSISSRAMNPSEALSLRGSSTQVISHGSPSKKSITNKHTQPVETSAKKSEKKPRRKSEAKKPVYKLEDIPVKYRTKPQTSYSSLIGACLSQYDSNKKGMSLPEIYKAIQEKFPYYKYCQDGWQNSVRHNLSLNKAFKKISKEGKGFLWGIDEEYKAEKEKSKKKKATTTTGSTSQSKTQGTGIMNLDVTNGVKKERSKTIAELAGEIKVHPRARTNNYTPVYPNYTNNTTQSTSRQSQSQPHSASPSDKNLSNSPHVKSAPAETPILTGTDLAIQTTKALETLRRCAAIVLNNTNYDAVMRKRITDQALTSILKQITDRAGNESMKYVIKLSNRDEAYLTSFLGSAIKFAIGKILGKNKIGSNSPSGSNSTTPRVTPGSPTNSKANSTVKVTTIPADGSTSNSTPNSTTNSTTNSTPNPTTNSTKTTTDTVKLGDKRTNDGSVQSEPDNKQSRII